MFTNAKKKLAEKWEGPYFVTQVHPKGVVDILKDNKIQRVNVDRLKPYVAPEKMRIYRTQKITLGKKKLFSFHR
jgi:hypothetical protein